MSIYDKISNAQETTWLTDGIAEAEAKSIIELAKIPLIKLLSFYL